MLSASGPRDAYDYVVRTPSLSGTTEITRSRTIGDATTGAVTTWVAGPSGAVSAGAVTLAQTAVVKWAAPLCVTPVVSNAVSLVVAVTYEIWLYDSVGETDAAIAAKVAADLLRAFQTRPIGGDVLSGVGKLYKSFIEATLKESYPRDVFRVSVSAPVGDTTLATNQVVALGVVTGLRHIEPSP
jgi:hypothetical protein